MQLKTLILDIETKPMVVYAWERRDITVALNQIKEDWSVLAWSAKWLGEPASKIFYKDLRGEKDYTDDRALLKPLWKLLDEADVVITQNGQKFDGPKLNARFITHGWNPPSPYKHLDTFRIARKVAAFTSSSLEYLTGMLCTKYKKLGHGKFPGQSLWTQCLAGNKEAWDEMKKYNTHDVLSTEELYGKLRAWAPDSMASPYTGTERECVVCGNTNVELRGSYTLKSGKYERRHCMECGCWRKGDKIK